MSWSRLRALAIVFTLALCATRFAQAQPAADNVLGPNYSGPSSGSEALGCQSTADSPVHGNQRNRNRLRAEWMLGFDLARDVEQHIQVVRDADITGYLNRIEQHLVNASSLDGCFVVQLIVDPEPNAYSLPGGFLYLTTGLLRIVESESQIAAALAHETAHVTARHLTRIERRRHRWGRIALLSGPAGIALRYYLGGLLTMKALRDLELEADQRALGYYVLAGYEEDFASVLQSAFTEDEENLSFSERLLDTHPPTAFRIKLIHQARQKLRSPEIYRKSDTDQFTQMKRRLDTLDLTPHYECNANRFVCQSASFILVYP